MKSKERKEKKGGEVTPGPLQSEGVTKGPKRRNTNDYNRLGAKKGLVTSHGPFSHLLGKNYGREPTLSYL